MEEVVETCNRINEICYLIAKRDGFTLPPKKEGGFYKKPNGLWEFREGKGRYVKLDGEMQWQLS